MSALFNSTYFLDNDYKNNNNNDNDNDVQEGEDFNNNNNNNNNNYDDDNYVDDLNGSNSGFPFICALYRVDMDLEKEPLFDKVQIEIERMSPFSIAL